MDLDLAPVGEHDRDAGSSWLDLELDAALAHCDHPLELEAHLLGLAQLPGNAPLSLVERMVDQRRSHDQTPLGLALGDKRMKSVGKFLGDEAGREPSLAPARMLHQRREKRDVVADAVDDEVVERGRLRVDRGQPVGRVGHELGDHRIVVDRDLPALEHAGVVAHGDAVMRPFGRRPIAGEPSGRGQEAARRILGVDAALDRPAVQLHVGLAEAQRLAGGAADHLLDEIDAGDEFGHRMLDLQAGVHLEEIEAAVLPRDELDGAGGIVSDRLGERDRLLAHLSPRRLRR